MYNVSAGIFGDDSTFSTNLTSAGGIVIVGTLSADRTSSTSLTAKGTIAVTAGGTFDWGTVTSPILSSFNHQIVLNYSLTAPADHKHIFVSNGGNISMYSALQKTRNTFLTLSANAAATQITVSNATNWLSGDRVVLESDNATVTREHVTTISNVNGNVITLANGLNFARLSGTRIGNFSSNLTVMPQSTAFTTTFLYAATNTSTCVLNNVRFESMGGNSPNWSSTTSPYSGPAGQSGLGINTTNLINDFTIENLAFEENTASSGPFIFCVDQTSVGRVTVKNSAFRGSSVGAYIGSGAIPIFDGCTWYKCTQINHIFGAGSGNTLIKDCFINSSAGTIQSVGKSTINNTKIKSAGAVSNSVLDTVFNNCIIQVDTRIATNGTAGALGTNVFNNCSFTGTAPLTTVHTTRSSDLQITKLNRPNNVDLDYRLFNYYYYGQTTTALRKNGITSLKINPNVANQTFNAYLSIPAFAGVSQRIKCNMRFDSTYGTATPPLISFVGAGVSTLCACAATANVWQTFDIDLNPTSTDDISVTVTGQSTSILGYVYLDGLPIDPYIQTARWYGFETDKNAFRTVNTLNTLTENQVSGLAVVSNLDYLYDAASYWSVTNPASSSYIDLCTVNGAILDFGSKNIVIASTPLSGFTYNSTLSTITINSSTLSAGTNFTTLKTNGLVTLSGSSVLSDITVNANVSSLSTSNLTGVTIPKLLSYNTNSPASITYTNCAITSATNTGSANVTIKKINSTVTYV
jgi:hypothetical protein